MGCLPTLAQGTTVPEVVIRSFDRTTLLGGRFRATTIPTFFSFSCIPQAAVVQYSYKEEAGRDGGQSRWESAVVVDKALHLDGANRASGLAEGIVDVSDSMHAPHKTDSHLLPF